MERLLTKLLIDSEAVIIGGIILHSIQTAGLLNSGHAFSTVWLSSIACLASLTMIAGGLVSLGKLAWNTGKSAVKK